VDKDAVGKVVHYYDKIGVAIVKLKKPLAVGDKVKFVKGDDTFSQTIESMQIKHEPLTRGKAGDEVGIKVYAVAKEGTLLFNC
jgi:putative protease